MRLVAGADMLVQNFRSGVAERIGIGESAVRAIVPSIIYRSEVIQHPQVRENRIVVETEHPVAGPLRQARPAAQFSATPAAIRRGAPLLGEHSQEILAELGYSAVEIAEFQAGGARCPERRGGP